MHSVPGSTYLLHSNCSNKAARSTNGKHASDTTLSPHPSASASVRPVYNMMNANELGRIVEEAVARSVQSNGELARLSTELARLNTNQFQMNTELARLNANQFQNQVEMKTELARLNANHFQMNANQLQMNTELAGLNTELARLNTRLDLLLAAANPLALESLESVPVVGQQDCRPLSQDPKKATWTYIKYQNIHTITYLVVGAYHCAFPFATRETSEDEPLNDKYLRFVELPREIASKVVEIGVYDPDGIGHHNRSQPLRRSQDIVVARLRNRPLHLSEESIPLWRNFRGPLLTNEARYAALVGRSLGTTVESVDGQVLFSPDGTGSGGMFTFNLRRGQPGDSGTLMFSFSLANGKCAIGIFCGLNEHPNRNHERRDEGAILPSFEELNWFPVFQPRSKELDVRIGDCVWDHPAKAFKEGEKCVTVTLANQVAQVFNRCGVFVATRGQSDYVGEREYARLSGILLGDDDLRNTAA